MARTNGQVAGGFLVTGPCQDGKRIESLGSALAYAMHMAGTCDDPGSWYVRGDHVTLVVEKQDDGTVVYERRGSSLRAGYEGVGLMPICPVCQGDRVIDWSNDRALMTEHLEGDELAAYRASDMYLEPVQDCPECEGTGVVTQARISEIRAWADKAIQRMRDYVRGDDAR